MPIVPPTESAVQKMLAGTHRDPQEIVGVIPPRWGKATVEKIAINAVMAGCLPAHLPVIITAVEAMVQPAFNLFGIQATTNPVAPLLIVNGAIVRELHLNAGHNALGQGWRANATIGRAIRLILTNVGGARPGVLDRATLGQPAKYAFCLAENEERNPWECLHVQRGFEAGESTVTLVGSTGTTNILDMASTSAEGVLATIAGSMDGIGGNNYLFGGEPLLILCPEHAKMLADAGFSKKDVQKHLFERTLVPFTRFSPENAEYARRMRPDALLLRDGHTLVPIADSPDDIVVIVAGGTGPHSVFAPTFGDTRSVTVVVRIKEQ